jgi:hypothetical protein
MQFYKSENFFKQESYNLHLMNEMVSFSFVFFFIIAVCFSSLLNVVRLKSFLRWVSKTLANLN